MVGVTMFKRCDNTSVAVIVKNPDGKILLIERKKNNPGWALPAGHQDGDGAEKGAKRELKEEVGLVADYLWVRLMITLQNPCGLKRGGIYHCWTIFVAEKWCGEVKKSEEEVKNFIWADKEKILGLARKLEEFMVKNNLSISDLSSLVRATNEFPEWKENLGLEPPMYILFKELKII